MTRRPARADRLMEVTSDAGAAAGAAPLPRAWSARRVEWRLPGVLERFGPVIAVYLVTRVALVLAMAANVAWHPNRVQTQAAHWSGAWLSQIAHWDGAWYSLLALTGYPGHALAGQTTLGFFPLYSLVIRAVAYPLSWLGGLSLPSAIPAAGWLVSGIGGLVCAVLVAELGTRWWGPASGRRAAIFFCVFPGSVIFSMSYAEGLMLPLAAGCLLALGRRRWMLAGALAGLATATEPEAVVLVLACAAAVVREARTRGWQQAGRSLAAPALSVTGIGAFAVYLWLRTGTPLATVHAQHTGWSETTDGLAVPHLVRNLARQINFAHFNHPTIDLNLVVGLIGVVILAGLLVALGRRWRTVPIPALVWTAGISFLAVTSEFVPPNPRLLITAFPAVMVVGRAVTGRRFAVLAALTAVALVVMSAMTFVGTTLRP